MALLRGETGSTHGLTFAISRAQHETKQEAYMMIGKFTEDGEGYTGSIAAFDLYVGGLMFSPVPVKQGSGPDFAVLGESEDGEQFEIGAAWKKTSKAGKPYLSVKLDGPTLVQPIHCALTRQTDGSYGLIWTRREKEEAADEASAA